MNRPDVARTSGDVAAWSAVLDELEAGLDGPAEWAPPVGLGPLPAALRSRAQDLVASLDARHAELAADALAVRAELDALAPMGPATRPSTRTVHAEAPAPRLVDHDA